MPSLRSNKNKWHIPPYPPPEGIRCINVPVPDDPQWIALFYGAIYRLSQQIWYDRDENHTAMLVASVWQDVYLKTIKGESECYMPSECCPLRRNPRTGRYEQSDDGGLTWFEVDDGPWVDSLVDGSVYWPEPKQRVGDPEVLRCDAAWAAANVLQSFYQQTVGALLTSAVGGVIGIARYLANLAEILSGIAIGAEMIDIAGDLFEQSAFFVDGGFPDTDLPTLRDILYCNSSVTDGAVSFDFAAVEAEVGGISGTPWDGLSVLLALYLNEDGLNAAGNIDFEGGDCSTAPCAGPFDEYALGGAGQRGWTPVLGSYGGFECTCSYDAANDRFEYCSGGWSGTWYYSGNTVELTFPETNIEMVQVVSVLGNGGNSNLTDGVIDIYNGDTLVATMPWGQGTGSATITFNTDVAATRIRMYNVNRRPNSSGAGNAYIESIRLVGTGTNPYGG